MTKKNETCLKSDQANNRAEYLQNGIEMMIANCDHPDELLDDLNEFMEKYYKEFFETTDSHGLPDDIKDLVNDTLIRYPK